MRYSPYNEMEYWHKHELIDEIKFLNKSIGGYKSALKRKTRRKKRK
jgi:hypothetical protein